MLLLDSHVALWALDDSPRLGEMARAALAQTTGIHISAATLWELTIKRMIGKIDVPSDLAAEFAAAGYEPLNVTHEHAEAIALFPELVTHDPFDRLLSRRRTAPVCGCSPRTGCCLPWAETSSWTPPTRYPG